MRKPIVILKGVIFTAALVPAALLVLRFYQNNLTANPVEYITHETGDWAITFLVVSLCVTPLRRLTGWNQAIKFRRMLGLFAFFYALLHFLTWFVLLSYFDIPTMTADVLMRPFITIGMAVFLILLALTITSNAAMIRRMGRRWQQLHRLVYLAAIGAVIHFWWLVKADITKPRRWAVAVAVLLGFRAWWAFSPKTAPKAAPTVAPKTAVRS